MQREPLIFNGLLTAVLLMTKSQGRGGKDHSELCSTKLFSLSKLNSKRQTGGFLNKNKQANHKKFSPLPIAKKIPPPTKNERTTTQH